MSTWYLPFVCLWFFLQQVKVIEINIDPKLGYYTIYYLLGQIGDLLHAVEILSMAFPIKKKKKHGYNNQSSDISMHYY